MKGKMSGWGRSRNLWIALALLVANGLAWLGTAPAPQPPPAEPRLDPQIADIREKLWSDEADGEPFSIVITDRIASEAIAWFLDQHPEVPFSHPWVAFDPQGATGSGRAHVLGLSTSVYGRAGITLRDGAPVVTIQELGVAGVGVPDIVMEVIRAQVQSQFDLSQHPLPLNVTRLELGEGTLTVEGTYR